MLHLLFKFSDFSHKKVNGAYVLRFKIEKRRLTVKCHACVQYSILFFVEYASEFILLALKLGLEPGLVVFFPDITIWSG